MGNSESKDENICSCSSSSSSSSSSKFCGSCNSSSKYAVNHRKSFSLAEKSKASDIIRFVVICSFFIYCSITMLFFFPLLLVMILLLLLPLLLKSAQKRRWMLRRKRRSRNQRQLNLKSMWFQFVRYTNQTMKFKRTKDVVTPRVFKIVAEAVSAKILLLTTEIYGVIA